jgi:hypothetical protein
VDSGQDGMVKRQPVLNYAKFACISRSVPCCFNGRASEPMLLWPEGAPGEKGDIGAEQDMTKPSDGLVDGRRVTRLGNVSAPSLTLYRPPPDKETGTAVVVCPGGGYSILAMDLEGTEVCQ